MTRGSDHDGAATLFVVLLGLSAGCTFVLLGKFLELALLALGFE